MIKFLLSLATAFSFVLFLGSCTNEEDINNNGYSYKEKAKIETLMNLFDSYGWELDTTVSIEPVSYTHLCIAPAILYPRAKAEMST